MEQNNNQQEFQQQDNNQFQTNMQNNNKKRKYMLIAGPLILLVALIGITYAFFNYTRTGTANTIRVGRISFVSENEETITLTNLFSIDPTETGIMNDSTKVGTYSIDIVGDTDYVDGIEYLVSVVDANITTNGKTLPISLDVTVTTLGTESSSYWTARNSKNATIYKKMVGETLEGNGMLLVGYIKPNTTSGTAEGIDGSITIKAYLDKNKILISDTYNNGETPTDNLGTPVSMGEGKTVFTTTEWNSLQQNGVSFKVKVEANEGIWVEEPLTAHEQITRTVMTLENPINFANISSSSNGEGLYILPGTENDDNPIYYYRGAINNNNVIFGDYCWQIVRTTDTGGIKMIYNGLLDASRSGENITYNCGATRPFQDDIISTTSLYSSAGYYYADDYEIVSTQGNGATYRLKSGSNPITQVAITSAADASANIPTIAANYPYTCMKTTDTGTCKILYKVDSYAADSTDANVYTSTDISTVGKSKFNSTSSSLSDAGYMNNIRYARSVSGWISGAKFGSEATWVTDHYELSDATVTTPDATHHYSCNATSSGATCTSLRYVYYVGGTAKNYITLTNGELIEDALYKMTGNIVNPNIDVVTRNSGYVLNQNDSTIKTAIESWFRENLTDVVDNTKTDYRPFLEDTIYCNDRSFKTVSGDIYAPTYQESGWNPNTSGTSGNGNLTKYLYYGIWNRYYNSWYSTSNVPSVACPNETDRFSVSSSVAHLNYPVGLLTADEIIMAGVGGTDNNNNTSYYLYTGDYYWTMSPLLFNIGASNEFSVNEYGNLGSGDVYGAYGVRPVVSLKSGIEFESGGDGTPTNPYVVKYE